MSRLRYVRVRLLRAVHMWRRNNLRLGGVFAQSTGERRKSDRLGNMVVHTGVETTLPLTFHGISGKGDDRDIAATILTTDSAGGTYSVEDGHLQIHENDVVLVGSRTVNRCLSIGDQIHFATELLEESAGDSLVYLVVFRDEDAKT